MFKKLRLWLIKKLDAIPNEVLLQNKEKRTALSTVTLAKTIHITDTLPYLGNYAIDKIKQDLAIEFGKEILNYVTVDTNNFNGFAKYDVRLTVVVPENKREVDTIDY